MKCNPMEVERNGSCSSNDFGGTSCSQSAETADQTFNRQNTSSSCGGPQMYGSPEPTYYRDFVSAIRTCLKDKYATFTGRATRSEFWFFYLFNAIVALGIWIVIIGLTVQFDSKLGGILSLLIYFGYFAAFIVPNIAVSVRRLHDTGKSGWLLLLNFIPFVGPLIIFVCNLLASDPYENKYGLAPREKR